MNGQDATLPQDSGLVIGVTGAIASGKSAVARSLAARLGGVYLSADEQCRILAEPGGPWWEEMLTAFAAPFLNAQGRIDRPRLRQALFGDEELRQRVNTFMHPRARQAISEKIAILRQEREKAAVVVEVPLLFEAGWTNDFARIVVVYAPEATILARLRRRDRLSREEAAQALAAQLPLAEKIAHAHHVIDNGCPWAATVLQILHLARLLQR